MPWPGLRRLPFGFKGLQAVCVGTVQAWLDGIFSHYFIQDGLPVTCVQVIDEGLSWVPAQFDRPARIVRLARALRAMDGGFWL